MTTHLNGSFRRGAFAATAAASLAFTSLFPTQAGAQTRPSLAAYQGSAACAKFAKSDPTLQRAVQCEARELDRRIAAEKQRGVDADRRAAKAEQVSVCAKFLMSGIKEGRFTKDAMLVAANGKVTAINACEVARGFGHGQKAELPHLSVN